MTSHIYWRLFTLDVDVVNNGRVEHAEQTRTTLVDAAAEAIAEHGFTATSITQIDAAACVIKGAVLQ